MSAPQIPNLLNLRGGSSRGRGRGRGRGSSRGRGRGGGIEAQPRQGLPPGIANHVALPDMDAVNAAQDKKVQDTDWDAISMRQSAVDAGYLTDPFVECFTVHTVPRKLPIINRGTFVRSTAIDLLLESWIKTRIHTVKQIISLGAGTDTRYWRLDAKSLTERLVYHEFDFPEMGEHKLAAINATARLSARGSPFHDLRSDPSGEFGFTGTIGDEVVKAYFFHPFDLRRLPARVDVARFQALDVKLPTVVVSECCLCYLEVAAADHAIRFFSSMMPTAGVVLYEPVCPDDDFGRMMFANLAARELYMPTVHEYKTLASQKTRLRDLGISTQRVADVAFLWERWVPAREKERLARLEMVDEVEEWELLAGHYMVLWAWREWDAGHAGIFQTWRQLPGKEVSVD